MIYRISIALAIGVFAASSAAAQVVRFETSVGSFDMVLNPTNNPRLQGNVVNMLRYVDNGNYNGSWINRAAEGFVLQMGGFFSHTLRPALTVDSTRPVASFGPVTGAPMISGLSNTAGTVSLALSGSPANPNSGSSSFFINLGSNSNLDNAFTVFAAVPDMTVVNQIMALMQEDLTADPIFGASPNNLAFIDVPVQSNGFQVFIKRAFVVSDAMAITMATAGAESIMAESAAAGASGDASDLLGLSGLSSTAVPEPTSLVIAVASSYLMLSRRRARRR